MKLNNQDYVQILEFYQLPVPKKKNMLKKNAEKVLADKLCKCIKKVKLNNEAKSVGVCTRSVFNKKGITRGKFKCMKNSKKVTLKKRKKNLSIKKKNKNPDKDK